MTLQRMFGAHLPDAVRYTTERVPA
jgi:hypothetical protein